VDTECERHWMIHARRFMILGSNVATYIYLVSRCAAHSIAAFPVLVTSDSPIILVAVEMRVVTMLVTIPVCPIIIVRILAIRDVPMIDSMERADQIPITSISMGTRRSIGAKRQNRRGTKRL
jgi:hypothetical protein